MLVVASEVSLAGAGDDAASGVGVTSGAGVGDAELLSMAELASPAAGVVVVAARPASLGVADSMPTLLDELDDSACCAPGGAGAAASTVVDDTCVSMVLAGGSIELKEKAGASGACMGNEPPGHRQWHLHPPLMAAGDAAGAFALPVPAMTVTPAPAFDVVVAAPMMPSFVIVVVCIGGGRWTLATTEPAPPIVMALLCTCPMADELLDPPATTTTGLAGGCIGGGTWILAAAELAIGMALLCTCAIADELLDPPATTITGLAGALVACAPPIELLFPAVPA